MITSMHKVNFSFSTEDSEVSKSLERSVFFAFQNQGLKHESFPKALSLFSSGYPRSYAHRSRILI